MSWAIIFPPAYRVRVQVKASWSEKSPGKLLICPILYLHVRQSAGESAALSLTVTTPRLLWPQAKTQGCLRLSFRHRACYKVIALLINVSVNQENSPSFTLGCFGLAMRDIQWHNLLPVHYPSLRSLQGFCSLRAARSLIYRHITANLLFHFSRNIGNTHFQTQ